jgi:hypothetical protein
MRKNSKIKMEIVKATKKRRKREEKRRKLRG